MRLYLSSFRLGNQPQLFSEMIGPSKKVAMIFDAGDANPDEVRKEKVVTQTDELAKIGLVGVDVDLRKYFGNELELRGELQKYGAVWVIGGNTFVLRRAMQDSGFDNIIKELLSEDTIVYGGYSAGACVLAPDLKDIELMDEPSQVEKVYNKEIIWKGLNILNYMPVPHYESQHYESDLASKQVEYLEMEQRPYKTIRDGEAIYINGGEERIVN